MNTQHNYMKPSPQAEAAVKGTRHATPGADDGGCSTHTTCGDRECVGNHSATDTPAGPSAQDWEHWEWTGGDMRLVLTMQQRRWNDTDLGYHKDMDYERGTEMVAAAYTPDDTTAGRWVLVGMWVVRNPTPDSVQQFISMWLDDGIQLASSAMRTRYDYPVFFDRILLSWDDTVKATQHAIQGEGWRVDWEWDFNRGADGRVVLTNTKDKSAPALVFVDPARHQQTNAGVGMDIRGGEDPAGGGAWGASATNSSTPGAAVVKNPGAATAADSPRAAVTVGKDTSVDAGLSAGSGGTHGGSEEAITAAARRAFSGAGTVGGAENTENNGGVPTAGSRATIDDGTNHADSVSLCGKTIDGGMTVSNPDGGYTRDKENPCQSAPQLNNAAHCSSFGVSASGVGVPATRVPDEDAYTLTRRGDTGTTGIGYASAASVHGDAVADSGSEKAGMFTDRHAQKENSFANEGGIGAELGFTDARPHECHAGDRFNADAGRLSGVAADQGLVK